MIFPPGFLGTRADLLIDIVMVSLVAIVPVILWSWHLARTRRWGLHRQVQLTVFAILLIVVSVFEYDLRLLGGIFEITKDSAYAGTFALNAWIWIHMAFSITTSLVWIGLVIASLRKFARVPLPAQFSNHKYYGRAGMVCMLGAGLTAIPLYWYGFVL